MLFNNEMFSRMQKPLRTRLMNSRPFRLSIAAGSAAVIFCAIYFGGRPRRAAPKVAEQQVIYLIQTARFGKTNVNQEVNWLCHLLDGKSSGGKPFAPHQCGWQAVKISASLWRVEYDDRSVGLDGRPTASDKIWLIDTADWEIQPRTMTTLMLTAPELAGATSKKDLNDRFVALTGRPFAERASTLNQEIDTLPRWRISLNGVLTGRTSDGALQGYPKLLNRAETLANLGRLYPESERRALRQADVELVLHIGVDGSVGEVDVRKSTNPAFNAAAKTVGKLMRFSPALDRRGRPVAVRLPQPMMFRLANLTR
jgi:TonB family protein